MDRSTCAACQHTIDASARTCPFCGADPRTGARVDTKTLLQQMFGTRELSTSESVMHYARQRQGVVIALSLLAAFLVLAALHQFVTRRNATEVTDSPAVPLSELTDMTAAADNARPVAMPQLDFQYDGKPESMRTYIVEPGAVAPPEAFVQQTTTAPAAAGAGAPSATNGAAPPRGGASLPVPPARPQFPPQQ